MTSLTVKSSPTTTTLTLQNNNNRHSENITIWSHITSCLLKSWIDNEQSDRKLLIIDSRNVNEYNTLHVKNAINLPYSKIIKRRLLNDKISIIELLIKNSIADFFIDNKHECNIVVYDYESEHTNQLDNNEAFAPILLNKLAQKFKSVSFLIGGFVNFNSKYPHLCEKSVVNVFHYSSMEISPSSAACSSCEFTSPSNGNDEMLFIKPKLNQSLSSCDNNSIISSNDSKSNRIDLFQFLSPISQTENVLREPTKILDFLYLGSQEDSLSEKTMKALNITNVLNVSIQCPKPEFIEDAHFLRIPLNDGHAAKILPFFDVAYRFIEKCRKANSNVLIHCLAGISRSPTLAIAYLMKHKTLKSDEAYEYVKERRPTISPNFNFLGQLYEYEKIQQNELQKQQKCLENSMESQASNTIFTSISSSTITNSTTNIPFLKFTKKQQSAINLFESTQSNETSKYSPPKSQRKKQYVFQFNNSDVANVNENISSPQQSVQKPSLLLNPIGGQSIYNSSLPSPSQAFSNFNLNSPSTTVASKTIINAFESSIKDYQSNMTKSYTINDINDFSADKAVMRRPTNLQMPLFNDKNVNNLKRPSSILLETNNNMTSNETKSNLSPCISANTRNQLFYSSPHSNLISTSNNSAAMNSASSTSSSCSSSASSSSASSTLISSFNITTNSNISTQQTMQQQSQKKIKLSPIQDRNILNNFNQNLVSQNDLSPGGASFNKNQFKYQKQNEETFKNEEALLKCKEKEDLAQTASSNSTVLFRKHNNNLMLNQSNTQENYMSTSKMNESKSLDTIRSILESPTYQCNHSKFDVQNRNNSLELCDENSLKNNDDLLLVGSSLSQNASISANNVLMKSSSNSSSKTGSNKNSLHGSIETMIEVS